MNVRTKAQQWIFSVGIWSKAKQVTICTYVLNRANRIYAKTGSSAFADILNRKDFLLYFSEIHENYGKLCSFGHGKRLLVVLGTHASKSLPSKRENICELTYSLPLQGGGSPTYPG